MEHFGNASHDDMVNLMVMSKNKNMNKATSTLMNGCHTWVKHRGELLETEKVEQKIKKKKKKNLTKFYKIFYGTEKTTWTRL